MTSDDAEAQADELTALASIFEERVFSADDNGGQFSAYLELSEEFCLMLADPLIQQARNLGVELEEKRGCTPFMPLLQIDHLPPIVLNFEYPKDYPSVSPPTFTLSCKWLSVTKLSELCSHLDRMWRENQGEVIIFQWTQFLVIESLGVLNIKSPLSLDFRKVLRSNSVETRSKNASKNLRPESEEQDAKYNSSQNEQESSAVTQHVHVDPRAIQDIANDSVLLRTLIEHNQAENQRVFKASFFNCLVCFSEKLGVDCLNFQGCNHVYCKDCVRGYFQVQIEEGNVKSLNCPSSKCDSPAMPSQVRELVGEKLFATYDRLLLQRTLECMDDIVYCPRVTCQCAIVKDVEAMMAVCSACRFPFCIKCRMAYHGVSPCKMKKEQILKLRAQYAEGDEDARAKLEQHFGKRAFREIFEEFESQRWKDENSKECPKCHTSIEKIDGCNKMSCSHCCTFFCWTCLKILSRSVPYQHYNDPKSSCFNQLFNFAGPVMQVRQDEWVFL